MVIYDSYLVTNLHTHTLCAHVFDRIACNYNSIRWCVSTDWNSHFYFYTWSNDIWHFKFLMCKFFKYSWNVVGIWNKNNFKAEKRSNAHTKLFQLFFEHKWIAWRTVTQNAYLPMPNFWTIDQHIDSIFNVKFLVFILNFTYYNPDKTIKCTKQNWFSKQF